MPYVHIPAMVHEVLQYLDCKPGKVIVDCTLGAAGHAKAILEQIIPNGFLIGIDQDKEAIESARDTLRRYSSNIELFHGNFVRISEALSAKRIDAVDGILLDLGVSLHQLKNSGRGFSFNKDEPLDMRMNTDSATTAADIVNNMSQEDLVNIFRVYGQERWARRIARAIVSVRSHKKIRTSAELAELVLKAVPKKHRYGQRIHPATRVFMSLRIAVNKELERLEQVLKVAVNLLKPKGRLCVLSYHSLEDRIVKQQIRLLEKGRSRDPYLQECICDGRASVVNLTRKPIRPSKKEIKQNPMARSARLRAIEKH
ncbi:MAG: 16S rRNA (cytosine(1402)-N(4))-methyltransferase RsmH [Deltaproteobacteria bacterium]|nr:16S rRNA (cytosine(1402)-N(4))-methyltransferase RsmH [Deltaproteobacteria bacterium]MBW1992901.1 16S rRNA (cytosine(1402)-N(4))-methyltransferase RsmH [Deltaproteobacteria bacterium]MBW2151877.1 16S rRNA (cytosine(1402)-N(4))-methyltransferase RsmH [Deltaproteobacteria bacterium]